MGAKAKQLRELRQRRRVVVAKLNHVDHQIKKIDGDLLALNSALVGRCARIQPR